VNNFNNNNNNNNNTVLRPQKKSRSITFRLDSFVVDELQREANQTEISLNVLVNKILKKYVEWGRYEQDCKDFGSP